MSPQSTTGANSANLRNVKGLYRPTYTAADGTVRTSAIWWLRYRQHGQAVRQSSGTTSERAARAMLREKEGRIILGLPVHPQTDKLTLNDGLELIRRDYEVNGRKSTRTLEARLVHLLDHFDGASILARIQTAHVEAYKAARLEAGAEPSTVNRETAVLARMGALARQQYGLHVSFLATALAERNVRVGFFEEAQFQGVVRHLQPELAALARVAYVTGWRRGELLSRQWRHVDFDAGWLRLEPEETKNRDGRMFPLVQGLRDVLLGQRARVEAIQRATGRIIPEVFVRDDGQPVRDFKRAWTTARRRAGVPGRLFHDFRRTAVRNLIRAGIPETVAMKLTGHRTRSVFQRYAIVEEGMLKEAGERLAGSR
jgi:integrase